ncbi:MAG TPA: UbiH/UbiF/VisC/COQ6 family ubiquinone biosynthesis hydroxylase [Gammaproteobacteria bacterium]
MSAPATVLVSGGGPVGLALAALLAGGPCGGRVRVKVLEPRPAPPWDPERMDLRVYALSRASQRIFERLGRWDDVLAARASPYRTMRVWQGDEPRGTASIVFDSADIAEPDLGHIVEDRLLRQVLADAVRASPHGEIDSAAEVVAVSLAPEEVTVTLADGRTDRGALLVAADGSESRLRALLGLATVGRGYGQRAIVTHVTTELPHEETAWQRFLPGGPLAFLPLLDGRSSVVWSMPEEQAARLCAASDDEFLAALQQASGGVLGLLGPCTERASFALKALHAPRYTRPRAVLLGDAAHTVHPLAGQGMNLGLLDAACLAAVLERAVEAGEDIGDLPVLRRYERERKPDNLRMLVAFDALERLFRLPAFIAPVRGLGMAAVNGSGLAKRLLIAKAMGLAHR